MIGKEQAEKIQELIQSGWECSMVYECNGSLLWETDFTRKLVDGRWDNHECGYSEDLNESIDIAYNNIKTGKRLII